MSPDALESFRQAGRVARVARDIGATQIVPGARVRDVCERVEDEIRRLGGEPAFPAQSSRNHVAAHYCPSPVDETVYAEGDLAKLDVGVHVDGYIVDTAVTVNVGNRPENLPFVEAVQTALETAISLMRAGIEIRRVSEAIARAVRARGLRPMRNLCGHGVSRWRVHAPPAIPNAPEGADDCLESDTVIAVEPFATDGLGFAREEGPAEVFRLTAPSADQGDPRVLEAIRAFHGLPFARRQLRALPTEAVEDTLLALVRTGRLMAYSPLAERSGRRVAQAEHTMIVGESGVEVLTR